MKKVLIIEDDASIAELIDIHLQDLSFQTTLIQDGLLGLSEALSGSYDLIILDVMLPGKNGLEICKSLRMSKVSTPIMMLTSKSEEIDKVLGLEYGADDYMTKPFSVREFQARVKALFRRINFNATATISDKAIYDFGKLKVDTSKKIVSLSNERIDLTPKEFDLLAMLAKSPGSTYSRQQLLNSIWGYEFEGYEHTVNSHINRLRAKIEKDVSKPIYILTTWGMGYRFNDEL